MQYIPIALPFFLVFWLLFGMVVLLIQIGILHYVFESMGVSRRYMFSLLVCCLLGSYINIPIAQLPAEQMRTSQIVDFYGMPYVVPVLFMRPGPVLAVNLGGAVIPLILSLYLMMKHRLYGRSVLAVGIVAWAVHHMARPVAGVGIAVPIFIPPLIAAVVAVSIARWRAGPRAGRARGVHRWCGQIRWHLPRGNRRRAVGGPLGRAASAGAARVEGWVKRRLGSISEGV
jgi:uncharacterized membrane protein